MGISLKPQHLNRYRQIAWLFVKYGRWIWSRKPGSTNVGGRATRTPKEAAKADELAEDLEKLGPTFVKLGQLLSTRVELMPRAYLEALARLQDKVEPFVRRSGKNSVVGTGRAFVEGFPDFDAADGFGLAWPGPSRALA